MYKLAAIFYLFASTVQAQILDNSNCDVFSDNNFFNQKFIKKNGITTIRSTILSKREMKPIIETPLWQQFDFDKYGRVERMMETYFNGSDIDTSLVQFKYAGDHLIKKRLSDSKGFYSYSYQYDDQHNLEKMIYSREVNANPEAHNFVLGQLIEVYKERYENSKISDKKTKRIIYNSDDKPYLQELTEYDEYGNKKKELSTLVVTKKGSNVTYSYDAYHRPVEKLEINNLFGKSETRYEYKYDEAGNLLSEKKYEDGAHKTTREFMYDGRMLLSARLTKDESTGTIQIVKYTITFD
jgi:YD repeat-containing protein